MKTLKELGIPWAEIYTGSDRFTGRLVTEPTYCQNGDVAPNWCYVGDMTQEQFKSEFEWQEHQQCHSPSHSDWSCVHCDKAGWNERDREVVWPVVRYYETDDDAEYLGEETLRMLLDDARIRRENRRERINDALR